MRIKALFFGVLALMSLELSGCAVGNASYSTMRQQANASLEQIAAEVPEPKQIVRNADGRPYSCKDPLLTSTQSEGAFFTGQWTIYGPDGFDREAFISSLPDVLGEGWTYRDLGIDVSFAYAYLVNTESDVQVNVRAIELDGRPALDVIAISRCGVMSDEDPLPSSTAPPG